MGCVRSVRGMAVAVLALASALAPAISARAAAPDCRPLQPDILAQKDGGYPKAIAFLEQAANRHDGCAELVLGMLYMSGVGDARLYRDPPRAMALWRAAENDGLPGARIFIARVDEHGPDWMIPPPFKEVGQNPRRNAGAQPPDGQSDAVASKTNTREFQPPNTIVGTLQQYGQALAGGNSGANGGVGSPLELGIGMQCAQKIIGSSLSANDQAQAIANCKARKLRQLQPILDDAQKKKDAAALCELHNNCRDND